MYLCMYAIFGMCLTLVWQALQRYRRSVDEQDEPYDVSTSGARWAGDKHRAQMGQDPPIKQARGATNEPLVGEVVVFVSIV